MISRLWGLSEDVVVLQTSISGCGSCINQHTIVLKALDTIGNCQRPVFSLGVSQHYMHNKGVFSFIISQLQQPIELKFSQVCYFVHLLRYPK